MWSTFRAIAARIGLSAEQVAAVEREGKTTIVQDPRNSEIGYIVRPDPDWTERMGEAWKGTLVNSRRKSAGTIPVDDGRLVIADLSSPEQTVTAQVTPGTYEIILTIAHLGAEETHDYEEHVSHAFALLSGNKAVSVIEPMADESGTEVGVEVTSTMAFASDGVLQQIADVGPVGRIWTMRDLRGLKSAVADESGCTSVRAENNDGSGALIAFHAGHGREDYPLFSLFDADGNTVGVLVDCFVDNRPNDV
jgi:hypothetical protein